MPLGSVGDALGFKHLKGSERQKVIDQPGPSWRDWALHTGLKPYFILLLLILNGFVLALFLQSGSPSVQWSSLAALPFLVYADYVAYAYLWAKPPENFRAHRPFHPTWLHPFVMGRWHPDYPAWKAGASSSPGQVPPEEFV